MKGDTPEKARKQLEQILPKTKGWSIGKRDTPDDAARRAGYPDAEAHAEGLKRAIQIKKETLEKRQRVEDEQDIRALRALASARAELERLLLLPTGAARAREAKQLFAQGKVDEASLIGHNGRKSDRRIIVLRGFISRLEEITK